MFSCLAINAAHNVWSQFIKFLPNVYKAKRKYTIIATTFECKECVFSTFRSTHTSRVINESKVFRLKLPLRKAIKQNDIRLNKATDNSYTLSFKPLPDDFFRVHDNKLHDINFWIFIRNKIVINTIILWENKTFWNIIISILTNFHLQVTFGIRWFYFWDERKPKRTKVICINNS